MRFPRPFLPAAAAIAALSAAAPARPHPGAATTSPPAAVDKSGYTLFDPTPDDHMRAFATDRPNQSNSPYTVDAGHFQYETDLLGGATQGYSIGGAQTRLIYAADPVLKVGVLNDLDLEVVLGGYQNLRTQTRGATGSARTYDGFGDVTLRAKANLWGNDDGRTAAAIIPYVKLPTAAAGLGNGAVEGGVIAPFQIVLPGGFSAILMTEFDVFRNANDDGRRAGYTNLVNVSHAVFSDKMTASLEFASHLYAGTPDVYQLDASLAWLVAPNTQLDTAVYAGLNKAAPDAVAYVGLSQRF